jgi:hypothetical protein
VDFGQLERTDNQQIHQHADHQLLKQVDLRNVAGGVNPGSHHHANQPAGEQDESGGRQQENFKIGTNPLFW